MHLSRLFRALPWIPAITLLASARADVVISEIMYHPQSENPLEEYIELHNPDATAAPIGGWQFTSGVSFTVPGGTTIPAGGYLVVAANAAAFSAKYPTVTNYVAGWVGQLSNSSNQITLKDATLVTRDSVKYADDGDWATRRKDAVADAGYSGWAWYAAADGFGKSLELINKVVDNSKGQNWGDSANVNGTPGAANSIASTNIAPIITDVEHFPLLPTSTDVVTVNAKLLDELTTGLTATLHYKLDAAGSFTSAPMFDDGAHGDGLAGDGRYGAQIPAQANGAVVEFYVQASDSALNTRTWPKAALDYNTGTSTYFTAQVTNCLYQVDNTVYAGAAPIYRMVVKAADKTTLAAINDNAGGTGGSHAKFNMTWITVDGMGTELRYTCAVRNRGHGSGGHDPQSFHASFPNDYDWKGKTGLNLNTFYTYLQLFGSALMRKAELACFESRQVQVRINATDLTQAGGLSADGGHSYYFYVANENPDTNYADHHFPTDSSGNIYSVRREDVGSLEGDLDYLGSDPNSYRTVYFKDTNVSDDNWNDLIGMTLALSKGVSTTLTNVSYTPSAAAYEADILSKIDVDQWMRWMAAENITGNNETNLVGGYGDDYYLYFGKTDIRAKLLPHDLDTILGHGDQNSTDSPPTFASTDSIFQMLNRHGDSGSSPNTPTPLNAFIRHPSFAPLFYQAHLDLMTGLLSQANFDSIADQILTGVVSAPTIANRKTWYAARLAYVAAQIPTTISSIVASTTGGTALATSNGYPLSTAATCKLSGRAHAGKTRSVKINGTAVSWDAFNATWTANPLALNPGLNRFKIESFDSTGAEFEEAVTTVWYDDATVANVSGTLGAGTTTWTPAGGPYQVTAALTVPATGTLVIQPGTTVYLASTISVTAGGKIIAEGTEAQPIRFSRAPAATANGGTITINGSAGAPETHFYYTYFEFGGDPAVVGAANSNLVLDHCEFGRNTVAYLHLDGGSFVVSHCIFPDGAAGSYFEGVHGANAAPPAGGRAIIRDSYFGKMNSISSDYNDVFDFTGGNRPGPIIQFINNVFTGTDDDILDIDGTDCWVEGNIFMNIHRSGSPDSASAVSGGNDGGGGTGSRKVVTAIDTATDQLTCGTHGYTTGQEVVATALVSNTFPSATPAIRNGSYFVRVISTTVVRLYLTAADANADTNAINFTSGIATGVSLSLGKLDSVSHITLVGNLFYNLDQVATAKEGNFYTLLNNTVVNQNNTGSQDAVTAIVNLGDDAYHEASGMYLEGNVVHSAVALARNYPGAGLTQNVTFNNNILPPGLVWTGSGSGNTNVDPLLNNVFRNPATGAFNVPTPGPRDYERLGAQIRQQFGLQSASPAKGTGPNGADKGGVRTLGVSLSGAPVGTTNLQTATINVGTRMTGNGISAGTGAWANGSGWTHYKYRLDGGALSAETVNSAPITLSGLANGSHTLQVVGKNDAGQYQDDAAFGTSARIASATWTVNTAYVPPAAAPIVRINEVLASNTETFTTGGVFPDIIELTNVGNATADLTGWGLTDDAAAPYKFTFANGTTLAPGAFLTIYASTVVAVTPKTGFAIKQSGDDLTLTKSATQGGTIADSVTWGQQLNDYSIGRALDGSWQLCKPSFGAANILVNKGDVTGVRINEWLASAATLFANDFIELYNPSTQPVDIGGCHLTDNPSEFANKHLIQPLTFIGNPGYISFKADGDTTQGPDHVNFKLSPLQGEIGFMNTTQDAIDVVVYGPQTTDISQGRSPNGALTTAFFTQPTPAAPNPGVVSGGGGGTQTDTLVTAAQVWKYVASATDPFSGATTWKDAGFVDTAWSSGGGVLYIENSTFPTNTDGFAKTTLLAPATVGSPNLTPYQTYYFRTHFTYNGPLTGVTLNASMMCDDGAVFYLNGQEITQTNGSRIRANAGPDTYALQAAGGTDNSIETAILNTNGLVVGDNVIAVSVHQNATQSGASPSSDITWGLKLTATYSTAAPSSTVVINEVLPINLTYPNPDSSLAGWVELYNPTSAAINLQDYSLSNEVGNPRKFVFPSATIPANGYLAIACNALAAASATNTGFALSATGDQIYLFNKLSNGGSLLDSVVYGQQLPDRSVARIPNASGAFALAVPTRTAINTAAATTAVTNVKLNEWLTSSSPTWLELYNTAATPVLLSGNYLTDSFGNKTKHLIPPLTFLGGSGASRWLQLIADNDSGATPNHVNFTIENGEGLWLFTSTGTQLDGVAVTVQSGGASQGRLADGSATIVALLPTPGAANQSANTDTDGDGIPDLWELANGLNPSSAADAALDSDGDGQSNKSEYLAGTNPQLPGSKLAASVAKTVTPGQYAITFIAVAGKTYTVRYKDDLLAATWTTLQQVSAPASDTVTTINDTPGVPKRFYQVVTPQQP